LVVGVVEGTGGVVVDPFSVSTTALPGSVTTGAAVTVLDGAAGVATMLFAATGAVVLRAGVTALAYWAKDTVGTFGWAAIEVPNVLAAGAGVEAACTSRVGLATVICT
jgi:hypothetical protein